MDINSPYTWEDDSIEKANEIIRNIQIDTLKNIPVYIRVRWLRNMVSKAIADGYEESDLDGNLINEILMAEVGEYDYNMAREVSFFDEIDSLDSEIVCATVMNGPWQKHKCKDCGKEFTLTYNEVHFYLEKELHIPKRCKDCRAKRKAGK